MLSSARKQYDSLQHFSTSTFDSTNKRKLRFQRKKQDRRCDCSLTVRNRSSCDSISLEKFYVKNSFLKTQTPQKHNISDSRPVKNSANKNSESFKLNQNISTCIQIKNDSQLFQYIDNKKQLQKTSPDISESIVYFQSQAEFSNQNISNSDLLKQLVFYKQKFSKHSQSLNQLKKQIKELQNQIKTCKQVNKKLKNSFEIFPNTNNSGNQSNRQVFQINSRQNNKNLFKLKKQFKQFRQLQLQQKINVAMSQKQLKKQIQLLNRENGRLKNDLSKQYELYTLKIKMMQQKEQFLQNTLNFTKIQMSELRKNNQTKELYSQQNKRLSQLLNERQKQLTVIKSKYTNMINIINGDNKRKSKNNPGNKQYGIQLGKKSNFNEKRRSYQIHKSNTDKAKINKSQHSFDVKSMIYDHKQKNQIPKYTIKYVKIQQFKQKQSFLNNRQLEQKQNHRFIINIQQQKEVSKYNNRAVKQKSINQIKNTQKQTNHLGFTTKSTSDMSFLLSQNSLQLSLQI